MTGFIYLIREREFILTKKNIFKIGKSSQKSMNRINSYSNGSILELLIRVNDEDKIETNIIKNFSEKYIRHLELGNEYFEGDRNYMIKDIYNLVDSVNIYDDTFNLPEIKNNIKDIVTENERLVKILRDNEENEKKHIKLITKKIMLENSIKKSLDKQASILKTYDIEIMKEKINNFIDENYVISSNAKDYVKIKDLYDNFKSLAYFISLNKYCKRILNYNFFSKTILNSNYGKYYKSKINLYIDKKKSQVSCVLMGLIKK